jgi:hypothetical protein
MLTSTTPTFAAAHWTMPRYEGPQIATAPSDQGWRAIHSIVSRPSFGSFTFGVNTPSERNAPRTSWITIA